MPAIIHASQVVANQTSKQITRVKSGIIVVLMTLLLAVLPINIAMAKGTVKIITEPGKAQLFVDGKRKGTSPAKKGQTFAIKLSEGEYLFKALIPHASKSIYDYVGTESVFVADDTLQTIEITLGKQVNEAAKAKAAANFKKNPAVMVTVPAGSFRMCCVSGRDCNDREKPVHQVNINAFNMGATEVTFNQWDACVAAGACNHFPADQSWGRGNRPVINVSWDDIQVYLK
jgi:formylglycine-generating enzyme required for sulfatase activity